MTNPDPTLPIDDVGAETQGRFRYQVELATRPCLAILAGYPIERVICEWQEDYVVSIRDERSTLVSVKHLEGSQPRWTMNGLCSSGGLAHLFDRWIATGRRTQCLLQTNSGMRQGDPGPQQVKEACANQDRATIAQLAVHIFRALDQNDDRNVTVTDVEEFLCNLKIEDHLPDRRALRAVNLQQFVPEARNVLRLSPSDDANLYDAVTDEVAAASRNSGPESVLRSLADPRRLSSDLLLAETLSKKTIDRNRLLLAVANYRKQFDQTTLAAGAEIHQPTRLIQKLERAGIGPSNVQNARRLRLNWEHHRQTWRIDLPGVTDTLGHVETLVLDAVSKAEHVTRQPGQEYGPAMLDEVRRVLNDLAESLDRPANYSAELLLGCVYHLTSECQAWWSDKFELNTEASV